MHLVNDMDHVTDEKVPVTGKVTSFAYSKSENLTAYGMSDGTIYLVDARGKVDKLVGHLSRITKMKFNGKRLYSSSFDGKLLFWMTSDSQIKPITLFQSNSWLTCFTFDNRTEFIWAGGLNGNISQYLISLPLIAQRLRSNVNRNLTKEEWDHYVGKGIPYRRIKN
jgi:WD40 repeat protein